MTTVLPPAHRELPHPPRGGTDQPLREHVDHAPLPAPAAFDRTPPHDLHAEQAVLGAMILSATARADVAGLDPKAFYYPHHAVLFRVLCEMDAAGEPIDPPLVTAYLTRQGLLREATGDRGPGYLHDLAREVPAAAHAAYYADSVREKAAWRSLIEAGTRAVQSGHLAEGDPSEAIGAAVRDLTHAAEGALPADVERKTAADLFAPLLDRVQATQEGTLPAGIPTGFADLDSLTRGLLPKQFIVIAGRPAMGKSVLGMDLARAAARTGRRVVIFSLEMGADELVMRLAAAEAKVALHHLKSGQMTDDDWLRIERHASAIATDRIVVIDDGCSTLQQIRAHCLALKRDGGLDEVVIDYLQLMQAGGRRPESRQQEVSEISRNLKLLAKELDVPIVALSQLNRGPEQRQDKKPMVSDLRESGSIEQDADMVILLHREDAYDKESPRAGEADLIVAKHRNGPTATVTVAFQGHYARFVDMAQT